MSTESSIISATDIPENKLTRAMRWALLGAVSGTAAATTILILAAALDWAPYVWSAVPGLLYGLIIGLALRRRRLASKAQIAFLGILSGGGSFAGSYVLAEFYTLPSILSSGFLDAFLIGLLLTGLSWGVLQTACFAVLFRFARRPLYWGAWPAVGVCTMGVLGSLFWFPDDLFSAFDSDIWVSVFIVVAAACWYAAYTAAVSIALPQDPTLP